MLFSFSVFSLAMLAGRKAVFADANYGSGTYSNGFDRL